MRCANTGKSSNEGNLVHPENFHLYERIFSCLQYRPTFSALRREITYTGVHAHGIPLLVRREIGYTSPKTTMTAMGFKIKILRWSALRRLLARLLNSSKASTVEYLITHRL